MNKKTYLKRLLLISGYLLVFPGLSFGEECSIRMPNKLVISGSPRVMTAPGYNSSTHDWYGTKNLAVLLPNNGEWTGMGPENKYFDKFWWWSADYSIANEPNPDLNVTAKRQDANSIIVEGGSATNGFGDKWQAMLIGFEFPSVGCWEIKGTYKEYEITFVLKVD